MQSSPTQDFRDSTSYTFDNAPSNSDIIRAILKWEIVNLIKPILKLK